ncbi:MAG: hypothetical protein ACYTG3_00955 [Planctomycetota bacterium]
MTRCLLALVVLAGLSAAQDKETQPKTAGEIEIEDAGATIEDAAVAKREVARFGEKMKAAADDAERVALLTRLGGWNHTLVFRAASKYVKHKSEPVAIAAIAACARQAATASAGGFLFKRISREKREPVICALWVGAGRHGYDKTSAYKAALKVLKNEKGEVLKAATRYLGYVKAKKAFRVLAELLEEPPRSMPAGPNGEVRVMPASYWQAIHDSWFANLPHVRWAMSQLVPGETFETKEEAREWAEAEGRKHGIRWK